VTVRAATAAAAVQGLHQRGGPGLQSRWRRDLDRPNLVLVAGVCRHNPRPDGYRRKTRPRALPGAEDAKDALERRLALDRRLAFERRLALET